MCVNVSKVICSNSLEQPARKHQVGGISELVTDFVRSLWLRNLPWPPLRDFNYHGNRMLWQHSVDYLSWNNGLHVCVHTTSNQRLAEDKAWDWGRQYPIMLWLTWPKCACILSHPYSCVIVFPLNFILLHVGRPSFVAVDLLVMLKAFNAIKNLPSMSALGANLYCYYENAKLIEYVKAL